MMADRLPSTLSITVLTISTVVINSCLGLDQIVSRCPCNESQWNIRSQQNPCKNKIYTCILSRNESLMEVCMHKIEIESTEVGCPFIDYRPGGDSLIGAPLSQCDVYGCPILNHPRYSLSELYKYPMCYIPVGKRNQMSYPEGFENVCTQRKVVETTTAADESEVIQASFPWWAVLILVLLLVFGVSLAVVATIYIKRINRFQRYKQEVEEFSLAPVMECNNYATGLAWSHYTGYLKLLLPVLKDEIVEKSTTYKSYPDQTFTKWIMLCPKSAKSLDPEDDPCIKFQEELAITGTFFKVKIYEVKRDGKCRYCCMECPSALMSLGNHSDILSPANVALEVERFTYYMQSILDDVHNSGCKDKAVSILFDDTNKEDEGLSMAILSHLEVDANDKEAQITGNDKICLLRTQAHSSQQKKNADLMSRIKKIHGQTVMDVAIEDKTIALKALNACEWVVVYLLNDKSMTTAPWLCQCLSNLVQDGTCKIILIVNGAGSERLIKLIPWIISTDIQKDKNAYEKIENAIHGKPVSRTSDLPIGDVSFGLTWAFYVNYLQHVTPDLLKRMATKADEDEIRCKFGGKPVKSSQYLWEIVPRSCKHERSLKTLDGELSEPFKVDPSMKQLHGQHRTFPAFLYHFEAQGTNYLFLGEVFSPCKALRAMKESDLMNVTDKEFNKLRGKMVKEMRTLLDTFDSEDNNSIKTKVIEYNDSGKEPLSEILRREIDNEVKGKVDNAKKGNGSYKVDEEKGLLT